MSVVRSVAIASPALRGACSHDAFAAAFGEHKVPLWIDKRQVPEEQTLTVIVRKKR